MSEVGKLEEEARKRKERLLNMRNRASRGEGQPPSKRTAMDGDALPKPVFRSYRPRDESLKQSVLPAPKPQEVHDQVEEQLQAAKPQPLVEEVDLVNLAPRKPDWDLKRDVAKKLEKLEKRTQRAIAELIRERIQAGTEDLASAVEANMAATQNAEDEED